MRVRKILRFRPEKCLQEYGCRICVKACPISALDFIGEKLQYCKNCGENAACILACKRFAIQYDKGVVSINSKCNGCGECIDACRYGGLRLAGKRVVKCDLCRDISREPVCAELCPTGALEVVSVEESETSTHLEHDPEIIPEIRYLGDEKKLSASEWADISATYQPRHSRVFFRILHLPPGKKRLLKRYGKVSIYEIGREKVYYYEFSGLTYEDARIADEIKATLIRDGKHEISKIIDRKKRIASVEKLAHDLLHRQFRDLDREKIDSIARIVSRDIGGYGFIEFLLEDRENIENIEHLRAGEPVHVVLKDKKIGCCKTNFLISDDCAFRSIVNRIAEGSGKSISEANPKLDFFIDKSDRVMALYRPYSSFGGSFSLRLSQTKNPWTLPRLVKEGSLSHECAAYLWMLESTKIGGVFTGPPGCGKTSLLNAVIQCVPPGLVVRTIEEGTRELVVSNRSWSCFVGKSLDEKELSEKRHSECNVLTGEDLLSASLRFYTDRLYVGEIRGPEAKYFTTALNLGISAVKTTMHSHETGASVLSRLCSPPMNVDLNNLPYIRIFVNLSKCPDGVRRVTSVGEIKWNVWDDIPGPDSRLKKNNGSVWRSGNYVALIENVFNWNQRKTRFEVCLKDSIMLKAYSKVYGISFKEAEEELRKRSLIIQYLCRKGLVGHEQVGRTFSEYHHAKELPLKGFIRQISRMEHENN